MLDLMGYTLNQLSIVGMVIALGLLVDDSIVVVENIERYMRGGISAKAAAVSATSHIVVAIIGCTATLILSFCLWPTCLKVLEILYVRCLWR